MTNTIIRRPNAVEDFLNHKTMERGGAFLKDWKDAGSLEHFLHMAHIPTVVWTHKWPTLVVVTDKTTQQPVTRVFGKTYICPEDEDTLKAQWHRYDNETRKKPPQVCGMCRLLDWVYMRIVTGKLPLERAIFRIAGDIEKERAVIHAGGFIGELKADRLSENAKARLQAAGVSLKDGFKENCMAKAGYVAVVVPAGSPADGAQITTIASSLGDKLKDVIKDKMLEAKKEKGDATLGDPFKHPYQFEWLYDKTKNPNEQYRVRAFTGVKPPENILKLISGKAIDDSRAFEAMDQALLRAKLERACLLEGADAPPWDELFPVKAKEGGEVDQEAGEPIDALAGGDPEDTGTEFPPREPAAKPAPEVGRDSARTPAQLCEGIREEDLYICEGEGSCGKGSPTPDECVWCGATFDAQGNIHLPKPPEPEKAKGRSRNASRKNVMTEPEPPPAKAGKFKAGF